MDDEERIARLTELAQRVWPDAAKGGIAYDDDNNFKPGEITLAAHQPQWTPLVTLYCNHPRALDALEAALLVLAGDAPLVAAGQGAMSKLAEPAWVEQLAGKWRREGYDFRLQRCAGKGCWYDEIADTLARCAAELREHAKGGT